MRNVFILCISVSKKNQIGKKQQVTPINSKEEMTPPMNRSVSGKRSAVADAESSPQNKHPKENKSGPTIPVLTNKQLLELLQAIKNEEEPAPVTKSTDGGIPIPLFSYFWFKDSEF